MNSSIIVCIIVVVIIIITIIKFLATNEYYRYEELKDKICNEMCIPQRDKNYNSCITRTYGENDPEYCLRYAIDRVMNNDRNNLCKIYECKL